MALFSISEIQRKHQGERGHFFDRDTMRFFGSRILSDVESLPDGALFVTSEKPPHGSRAYAVREAIEDSGHVSIDTVGEVCEYPTRARALSRMRTMAKAIRAGECFYCDRRGDVLACWKCRWRVCPNHRTIKEHYACCPQHPW